MTIAAAGLLFNILPVPGFALLAAEPEESSAEETPTLASPQTVQPPPTKNDPGEQSDQFTPTEKIKADNVVSFPVDI